VSCVRVEVCWCHVYMQHICGRKCSGIVVVCRTRRLCEVEAVVGSCTLGRQSGIVAERVAVGVEGVRDRAHSHMYM
jgi:hypothetical protein